MVVSEDFYADNSAVELSKGMVGRVLQVDEVGDLQIDFGGAGLHWVSLGFRGV